MSSIYFETSLYLTLFGLTYNIYIKDCHSTQMYPPVFSEIMHLIQKKFIGTSKSIYPKSPESGNDLENSFRGSQEPPKYFLYILLVN